MLPWCSSSAGQSLYGLLGSAVVNYSHNGGGVEVTGAYKNLIVIFGDRKQSDLEGLLPVFILNCNFLTHVSMICLDFTLIPKCQNMWYVVKCTI